MARRIARQGGQGRGLAAATGSRRYWLSPRPASATLVARRGCARLARGVQPLPRAWWAMRCDGKEQRWCRPCRPCRAGGLVLPPHVPSPGGGVRRQVPLPCGPCPSPTGGRGRGAPRLLLLLADGGDGVARSPGEILRRLRALVDMHAPSPWPGRPFYPSLSPSVSPHPSACSPPPAPPGPIAIFVGSPAGSWRGRRAAWGRLAVAMRCESGSALRQPSTARLVRPAYRGGFKHRLGNGRISVRDAR